MDFLPGVAHCVVVTNYRQLWQQRAWADMLHVMLVCVCECVCVCVCVYVWVASPAPSDDVKTLEPVVRHLVVLPPVVHVALSSNGASG